MSERDYVLKAITMAEKQLIQAIDGIYAEAAETRTNSEGMTIRERFVHLGECCVAATTAFEGGEYEAWGSWQPADRAWHGVKKAWKVARAEAISKLPDGGPGLDDAFSFLAAHDFYHVG